MAQGTTCEQDRGAGLLSTSIAVLVFLLFMTSAVHLLTSMHATSTVMAVSTDAARSVAARDVDHHDPVAMVRAQQAAQNRAHHALGPLAEQVRYSWSTTADAVHLRVVIDRPWRLGPGWSSSTAFSHVDRTIVLQLEHPR